MKLGPGIVHLGKTVSICYYYLLNVWANCRCRFLTTMTAWLKGTCYHNRDIHSHMEQTVLLYIPFLNKNNIISKSQIVLGGGGGGCILVMKTSIHMPAWWYLQLYVFISNNGFSCSFLFNWLDWLPYPSKYCNQGDIADVVVISKCSNEEKLSDCQ